MFWNKTPSKADLQQHKRIGIFGHSYVIRKVNPLLDFKDGNIPQIFTSFVSRRKVEAKAPTDDDLKSRVDDMKTVVLAGLVSPEISKESGITIDDIFMDMEVGSRLYLAILEHSLNRFRGLRGFFFSVRFRYALSTALRNGTDSALQTSPLMEKQA
jgi:hypothetical protein